MNRQTASSRSLWLLPFFVALAIAGVWVWRAASAGERRTVEQVEPGLTLTTIERGGGRPLRMFVVNTKYSQGWRLRPVLADGSSGDDDVGAGAALRRTAVSQQLAAYNRTHKDQALVAVNGGFFAYEGGAVGAVKLSRRWLRLPWKNRTAIGFDNNGKPRVDNLKATARVVFGDGTTVQVAALNGYPVKNGLTVLNAGFARAYKLKADELALDISEGAVQGRYDRQGRSVSLDNNDFESFVVVANGTARLLLEKIGLLQGARFEVSTTPDDWKNYPTILGAGPRLVKDGQVHSTEVEEEFRPDVTQSGPRTAIGIDKNGNYFLVVVESGIQNGTGLTLPELAREMQAMGAVDAINLDGGASVALAVKDKVVTPRGQEVPVANSVVVVRE
jgi:uncharacterized protein YigE (DUF2233 family)